MSQNYVGSDDLQLGKAAGTELLSLISLASGTGEKVVATVIGRPSKHCLHMRVLQELLLQTYLSFPVQPACMHSLLSFQSLPDIIRGNVLQLQNTCVCPPNE